tara:strand:- start:537 stop:662 length:126 start_codon:yes stop_codon:yes gene_type:complete
MEASLSIGCLRIMNLAWTRVSVTSIAALIVSNEMPMRGITT